MRVKIIDGNKGNWYHPYIGYTFDTSPLQYKTGDYPEVLQLQNTEFNQQMLARLPAASKDANLLRRMELNGLGIRARHAENEQINTNQQAMHLLTKDN